MTRMRWWAVVAALFVAAPALSGQYVNEYVLFNGSNTSAAVDTLELASPWFPVQHASRIVIRLWSANTSAWTAADSTFADSLTTFRVAYSDSLGGLVNDLGAPVRGAATPKLAAIGGDSVQVDYAVGSNNPDTSAAGPGTMTAAKPLPINRALAGTKNGSGIIAVITPVIVASSVSTQIVPDYSGYFYKKWARIRVTPLRRMTEGGRLSTQGIRTVGVRGLRGRAYVYYGNK